MAFEPSKHLRNIGGPQERQRRTTSPSSGVSSGSARTTRTATIETVNAHATITPDSAIVQGDREHPRQAASATGLRRARQSRDFRDYYRPRPSTKAIGRALAALGYGTQFVGNELDEGERIVDSPTPRRTPAPTPASNGTPAPTARQAVPLTEQRVRPVHRVRLAAPGERRELRPHQELLQRASPAHERGAAHRRAAATHRLGRQNVQERDAVTWLWPGYLPFGKVAILDGDPGLGKSTIMLDLAARLSRGLALPNGKRHAPMTTDRPDGGGRGLPTPSCRA
jgi:hypothetical protein